ncbi:MAG: zinc ribbon domain-containing protein [Deltaproteobacteria bacterium]|nr:zinc ribbon domain-containing protein [Deltaproteobacteria bacterium]
MPIYEYEASSPRTACRECRVPFEVLQKPGEMDLERCPSCGSPVRKIISWCRSAVVEIPEESTRTERKIRSYESSGMWSHAAELADKHAEKTKDAGLRMRALDNYRKAGYDVDSLVKHTATSND